MNKQRLFLANFGKYQANNLGNQFHWYILPAGQLRVMPDLVVSPVRSMVFFTSNDGDFYGFLYYVLC